MMDLDTTLQINRISINEINSVVDLFNKYRMFYKQDSNLELAKQFVEERLENNESVIYVASMVINKIDVPVGFMQLYPKWSSVSTSKNWHIGDLYVDNDYRKKGIGNELLKNAIHFCRSQKALFLSLNTAKDNFTAQKVYEDFGFLQQELLPEYYYYQFDLKNK